MTSIIVFWLAIWFTFVLSEWHPGVGGAFAFVLLMLSLRGALRGLVKRRAA